MRYNLHGSAVIAGEINVWNRPTSKSIYRAAVGRNASHVWLFPAEPEVKDAFNLSLPQGNTYLLARDKNGWSVLKQWAHPRPRIKAKAPTESH